jgi:hypothetical protein
MPARDAGERVTAPLRGSCLCGSVRIEIDGPFEGAVHCHCASCKKLSGGVGTTSGRIATEAIHIVAGEDLLQRFQPEEGSAKTFCSACGSNLFGAGWPESEVSVVRLAAVDAGLEQAPQGHIFVRSVAPWETLPEDGLPRFEARP